MPPLILAFRPGKLIKVDIRNNEAWLHTDSRGSSGNLRPEDCQYGKSTIHFHQFDKACFFFHSIFSCIDKIIVDLCLQPKVLFFFVFGSVLDSYSTIPVAVAMIGNQEGSL